MDDLVNVINDQQSIIDSYETKKIDYNNLDEDIKKFIANMTKDFEDLKTKHVDNIKDINNIITPVYNKYNVGNYYSRVPNNGIARFIYKMDINDITAKYKGKLPEEISSAIISFNEILGNIDNDLEILEKKLYESIRNIVQLKQNIVRDTVNAIKAKIK
jgi:hypothetical protein